MSSLDPTATAAATTTTTTTAAAGSETAATTSSTKTTKSNSIKAVTGFLKLTLNGLVNLGGAVIKGMTGNAAFPNPPVDLTAFSAALTALSATIVAAMDGSRTAKAVRDKQRKLVTQDLALLAIYVQNNCSDDPAIFLSSGFTAKSATRTLNRQAGVPGFRSLRSGSHSGQVEFSIASEPGAKSYSVRYAVMTGTTPGAWTIVPVALINRKLTISNLTTAAIYGFQVQALGALGYSDWSDTKTVVCA